MKLETIKPVFVSKVITLTTEHETALISRALEREKLLLTNLLTNGDSEEIREDIQELKNLIYFLGE